MLRPMSQGAIPRRTEEMQAAVLVAVERLPARNSAEAARPAMAEGLLEDRPRMERPTEARRRLPQIPPTLPVHLIHLLEAIKETRPAATTLLRQRQTKRSPQVRALSQVPPQGAQEQQRGRRLPVPLAV